MTTYESLMRSVNVGVAWRALPMVFLVSLAAACGGEDDRPADGSMPDATDGDTADATFATVSVTPTKEALLHVGTGVSVRVPIGAVLVSTELSGESLSAVTLPNGVTQVGGAVRLGPEGQTFEVPVEVTMAVDLSTLPGGSSLDDVVVLRAPHGTSDFAPLSTHPSGSAAVVATTPGFSDFVPVVMPTDPSVFGPASVIEGVWMKSDDETRYLIVDGTTITLADLSSEGSCDVVSVGVNSAEQVRYSACAPNNWQVLAESSTGQLSSITPASFDVAWDPLAPTDREHWTLSAMSATQIVAACSSVGMYTCESLPVPFTVGIDAGLVGNWAYCDTSTETSTATVCAGVNPAAAERYFRISADATFEDVYPDGQCSRGVAGSAYGRGAVKWCEGTSYDIEPLVDAPVLSGSDAYLRLRYGAEGELRHFVRVQASDVPVCTAYDAVKCD